MNVWEMFGEGNEKPTSHEKFKRGIKSAGYDMDAGAKRLEDLLAKQKAEREEREKGEQKNVSEANDEVDYDDDYQDMVRRVGEKAKAADALRAQGKEPQTKFNPKTGRYYVDHGQDKPAKENAEELSIGDPVIITGNVEFEGKTGDIDSFGDMKRFVVVNLYNHGKHSFHSSDVSYNDHADIEEAGYGRNRGYTPGIPSPHAPTLGGRGRREDDEGWDRETPVTVWYILADGKLIKDKMGVPYHYRDKEVARKAAMTMMSKSFNAGKKFVLTTKPEDNPPENEAVLHTNYKRNRFKAINQRDQAQNKASNMAMNRVNDEVDEGMSGQVVFSGTGTNSVKYEIIQSGDGFMIHANGNHIDTYGSLQRAMSVLKNEVPGLQRSMAEATGDKPFDKMMTTIKQGTNKQKTADRKEQQKQTQQRARDAFGNMFGGGNPADKLSIRKGVAEGLDEAVGGNYLYHATSPAGLKGILQSGYIGAQQTAQPATDAQTKLPSVAVTRDWNYAAGSSRSSEGVGQGAVIVFDKNSIESKYKTFGTSQSWMTKGLPNTTADTPQMKKLAIQTKFKDANKNGKLDYDEVPAGAGGAGLKKDYFRPKSGGEAEEAVVVPTGKLPLNGTMIGFWVDPKSELMKDPTIMNDPRRLDMIRPNQFVKATQQQGVAEGSVTPDVNVSKVHDDGHEKEWHIYRGKEMIGYVIKNQPDTAEGLYIAYGHGPGRAFVEEFTGLKPAVNYIASLKEGVAEGQADQVKKIVKKNGKPVGEIGTDPEASPGNGNWYVKHYASGYDVVGFDNAEEALAELKHCMKQGVAENTQQVDSLVTDALKIMRGSESNDAVAALKTVLGDREYNGRRGFYNFYVRQLMDMYGQQGMAEERTETKNEKGEVTSWRDESDWRKVSKEKDGRGRVTNLSDKARRETEKLKKEKSVDEGWKSALGGAALAGAMALGGSGAHAQSTPSGEDFLPEIVAHVTFKVDGNTVTKDINLGNSFKSPGQASAALEKFLKSKGIKFYEFSIERVKPKNPDYLEKTPASDTGHSGSMDSGPYSASGSSDNYMAKESIDEAVDRAAKSMMEDGYEFKEGWSRKYKSSINCSHPKGFSQKAHCAGKKKHNESIEMEMVCEDCGMCESHGNLNEIAKGAKDSNGVTKCWPGKHAEGTKKGRNGGQVRNCVPNESVEEEAKHGLYYNVNKRKKAGTSRPASSPKAPTAQAWKDAAKTAKNEDITESMTPDEQFDMIEHMVESLALARGVDAEQIWEDLESFDDTVLLAESAAWRRKEGKSKKGGLNAKGVASYRRENPGSKLQTAVTTKPSKLKPGSKAAKRRKSFCARMSGVKGPAKKPNGKPTRKTLALRKWNC